LLFERIEEREKREQKNKNKRKESSLSLKLEKNAQTPHTIPKVILSHDCAGLKIAQDTHLIESFNSTKRQD